MVSEQRMEFPLPPGAVVTLYEDCNLDADGGLSAGILFEGTVEQYVEQTGLLTFKEQSIERAEFLRLVEQADGYQVVMQ